MKQGLSVRNLSFEYRTTNALDTITFELAPSDFCALLGPNGAGKSTLVALLTRLLIAPRGDIWIAGHDLRKHPRRALANLGVVFQQPTLDLNLTVRQNLEYFAALHGLQHRETQVRIDAALDRLRMRDRADEKVKILNGGHRRRMELARSLLHEPKVLLLDEPTVGLDTAARQSITDLVHDLAEQGLCVLWATHLADEVRDEDRLLVLHHGQIIASGQTGHLRSETNLSDWFLSKTETPK